jgi:hypothetical protein
MNIPPYLQPYVDAHAGNYRAAVRAWQRDKEAEVAAAMTKAEAQEMEAPIRATSRRRRAAQVRTDASVVHTRPHTLRTMGQNGASFHG